DAEAADLAQAVAVGVLELLAEQLAGLLQLRRVAGPQALVDLQQRLLVRVGRVLPERRQDERVLVPDQRRHRLDRAGEDSVECLLSELLARVKEDLAVLGVDDVADGKRRLTPSIPALVSTEPFAVLLANLYFPDERLVEGAQDVRRVGVLRP